jgi:hypothetical protein
MQHKVAATQQEKLHMAVGSVRKGVTQAKFNKDASNIIYGEIIILSGVVGYYYSDWYIFGGMLIGLMICMLIPVINVLLGLCLSVLWALIGAAIACFFQDINIQHPIDIFEFLGRLFSTPASQIIGGILFLSGLGLHLGTIEWAKDVTDPEDRNF